MQHDQIPLNPILPQLPLEKRAVNFIDPFSVREKQIDTQFITVVAELLLNA
jgi:hypothetical protein